MANGPNIFQMLLVLHKGMLSVDGCDARNSSTNVVVYCQLASSVLELSSKIICLYYDAGDIF